MRATTFLQIPLFLSLLIVRLLSAFYSNISDCDETFNYWEPLHYLMHGNGFQTWEYSPAYGIRSYSYIVLHSVPLLPFKTLDKVIQFYILRVFLAVVCAACEWYFIRSIMMKIGLNFGLMIWGAMISNCGMFISSAAFLPSSFSMYCTMVAYGALAKKFYKVAVFSTALGALVGWPFSAILGLPIALEIIYMEKKVVFFLIWSLISFTAIMIPSVAVDYYYFGRLLVAPLNIVLYNVFGKGGPDLYGTEKFSYYIFNGILNFNILFPFALLGTGMGLVKIIMSVYKSLKGFKVNRLKWSKELFSLNIVMALFLWLLIFMTRPHKEERFLFPVYPLLCFTAIFGMEMLKSVLIEAWRRRFRRSVNFRDMLSGAVFSTVFVHGILSVSRILALYHGYHAPLDVYPKLASLPARVSSRIDTSHQVNVCVGKEWYRFPNSFFLPSDQWKLHFIKSDFRGQLPKPFEAEPPEGTRMVPKGFNDMNKEEPSRYFDIEQCDFLIELDVPRVTYREPRYSLLSDTWETVMKTPFLDSTRSHWFFRAFYFPYASWKLCAPVDYLVLLNKNRSHSGSRPLK